MKSQQNIAGGKTEQLMCCVLQIHITNLQNTAHTLLLRSDEWNRKPQKLKVTQHKSRQAFDWWTNVRERTHADEISKATRRLRRVLIANHRTFLEWQQQRRQALNSARQRRTHPVVTLATATATATATASVTSLVSQQWPLASHWGRQQQRPFPSASGNKTKKG